MNNFLSLVIGIFIGAIVTYLLMHNRHKEKIAKIRRNANNYYQSQSPDGFEELVVQTTQGNRETGAIARENEHQNESIGNLPVEVEPQKKGLEIAPVRQSCVEVNNSTLKDFLEEKGIRIRSIPPRDEPYNVLDGISTFMAGHYSDIEKFYKTLKTKISSGEEFSVSLKGSSPDEICSVCQLGEKLHQVGYLDKYHYQKAPKYVITVRPSKTEGEVFITGKWIERFVKEQVIQTIRNSHQPVRYAYLFAPKIVLPNGENIELDLLIQLEDSIFWVEAKTGERKRYTKRYTYVSSVLGISQEHSFMVLTDLPNDPPNTVDPLPGMTVVEVDRFAQRFQKVFEEFVAGRASR